MYHPLPIPHYIGMDTVYRQIVHHLRVGGDIHLADKTTRTICLADGIASLQGTSRNPLAPFAKWHPRIADNNVKGMFWRCLNRLAIDRQVDDLRVDMRHGGGDSVVAGAVGLFVPG